MPLPLPPTTPLPEWATDAAFPVSSEDWGGQPPRDAASMPALAAQGHVPDSPTDAEPFNAWLGLASEWHTYLREMMETATADPDPDSLVLRTANGNLRAGEALEIGEPTGPGGDVESGRIIGQRTVIVPASGSTEVVLDFLSANDSNAWSGTIFAAGANMAGGTPVPRASWVAAVAGGYDDGATIMTAPEFVIGYDNTSGDILMEVGITQPNLRVTITNSEASSIRVVVGWDLVVVSI